MNLLEQTAEATRRPGNLADAIRLSRKEKYNWTVVMYLLNRACLTRHRSAVIEGDPAADNAVNDPDTRTHGYDVGQHNTNHCDEQHCCNS